MKKKDLEKQKNLTSKERKELRRKELEVQESKKPIEKNDEVNFDDSIETQDLSLVSTAEVGAVDLGTSANSFTRSRILFIIFSGLLAIALILTAIFVPISVANRRYAHILNPQGERAPVVSFILSNGERVSIVVYDHIAPHTATNFIYLARIGFFNGTIIFDTSNNFVRFGQFEDDTFRNFRTTNSDFLARNNTIEILANNVTIEQFQVNNIFDFSIISEPATNNALRETDRGIVSSMHNFSGVDFQISTNNNATLILNDNRPGSTATFVPQGIPFGRLTGESLAVVDAIVAAPQNQTSRHFFFSPPIETIYIANTRVYNLDFWGKWRTFNWSTYFTQNSIAIQWRGATSWRRARCPLSMHP